MKISIDLNDPTIQEQIRAAIEAKLSQVVARQVHEVVNSILAQKSQRITEAWVERTAEAKINQLVNEAFAKSSFGGVSEFQKILAVTTEKLLREKFRLDSASK